MSATHDPTWCDSDKELDPIWRVQSKRGGTPLQIRSSLPLNDHSGQPDKINQ
jgi:hypothetical protein